MPLPNTSPSPFVQDPLAGLTEGQTAAFYRLNDAGLPVGSLFDITPNPDRVRTDMIDSEVSSLTWTTTDHALQDLSSASSNVHRDLATMTITGTMVSAQTFGLVGSVGIGNIPGFAGVIRSDLQRLRDLRSLASRREAVMVITPRVTFSLAFITSVADNWSPDIGENTIVTIGLKEARIVNPLTSSSLIPDSLAMNAGSVITTPAGSQAGTPINTQVVRPPPAFGAAPTVQA